MDCPGTGFFIPGRGDQFRGGLQAQSVNRRSFISSTLSSPAMALTVDSTRVVGSQDRFRGDVVKGKDPLQLFPFGVENMGESGLFHEPPTQ